jgi:uncharacterized protein
MAFAGFLLAFSLLRRLARPPRRARRVILSSRPVSGAAQSSLRPTPVNERIESLDVLRGLALFMILTANMAGFYSPLYYLDETARYLAESRADHIVGTLISTFVQNESVALFSFLFGFGFAMQFLRARSQDVSFLPLYVRRLLTLVLIGLVHAYLIWMGDIVALYGVLGFLLLPFRNVNLRAVLVLALVLYFLPQVRWEMALVRNSNGNVSVAGASTADTAEAMAQEESRRQAENSLHAYGHGTWREMTLQRARDYTFYLKHNQALTVFPLFLLGLYAGRRGLFSDIPRHLPSFRFAAACSLATAFLSVILLRILYLQGIPDWTRLLRPIVFAIQHTSLLFFYVSAVVVLEQAPSIRRWMTPLAAAGRLALSNYIFQSVVCTFIFYSYGLALYGKVGPAKGFDITVLVFAAQVLLSVLWSRRFLLGPVEWFWRSVTYGRPQSMRL